MINAPEGRRRPIYLRWWFWVVFLPILLAGTWFLKNYYDWRGEYDLAHTDDYARGLAAQLLQYQADRLEEQYKNDTYGGDTPEETLRLFVEALEKKDYSLASRYFIPEKQSEILSDINISADSGGMERFIAAYKEGTKKTGQSAATGDYGIEIFPKGDNTQFSMQFTKNSFTHKWKITEL
jgi:hypothetical protein